MVLKFALKVGGIPSPVDVSGPPVVDNPSLPGNPLVQWVRLVPLLHLFQAVQSYLSDLYVLLVLYGHLQHVLPRKDHPDLVEDPLRCPLYFLCCYPIPMVAPYGLKPYY